MLEDLLNPVSGELKEGCHRLTWSELIDTFGFNPMRRQLLRRFTEMVQALQSAGCREIVLGGSFIGSKPEPGDIDGVWIGENVDLTLLAQLAEAITSADKDAVHDVYGAELYSADWTSYSGIEQIEFFMVTRDGKKRGVVSVDLGTFDRLALTSEVG